ncbi:MAG: hypothetical protein ACTSRO_09975 [Candidatus Heimdallarchaeaceae archaeon]
MGIEGVLTSLLGVDKKTLEETIGYTKKIFEMIAGHIVSSEKFYKRNQELLQNVETLLIELNDNVDDMKTLLTDLIEKLEPDWDKIGGTD